MKGVYLLLASVAFLAISTGADAAPDPKPFFWLPIEPTTAASALTADSDSANPNPTPSAAGVGR
uniref:Uncharacterized protein n=1 Tax=Coptotermes formosanus TaxID=36987 RepID=R4V0J9_COPFO|nr:hypothetical protein [Coptotermes formosanus]